MVAVFRTPCVRSFLAAGLRSPVAPVARGGVPAVSRPALNTPASVVGGVTSDVEDSRWTGPTFGEGVLEDNN